MPNEVYATARRELAAMLSPRAAERVLDDALASVRVSSEAVTPRQMRALLAGPIQDDLRAVLPPSGLNRTLRKVMDDLRAMSPTPPLEEPAADSAARSTTEPAARSAPHAVSRDEAVAVEPAHAPLLSAQLSADQLEKMARACARLDDVIAVTVVRDGKAAFVRGDALDANAAAGLVPIAAKVLARHGSWRSYTLVHDRGTLFIIPVGDDYIVLVGRPEFNLGAVLIVLATLEEDL